MTIPSNPREHAFHLYEQGLFREALQAVSEYEQNVEFTSEEGQDLALLKGKILSNLGDYANSIQIMERIQLRSKETGNNLNEVESMLITADCYGWMGNLFKTIELSKNAAECLLHCDPQDIAAKNRKTRLEALQLVHLGFAYDWTGEVDQAEPLHFKALEIQEMLDNSPDLVEALWFMGNHFLQKGSFEKALTFLNRAVTIQKSYRKIDDFRILTSLNWAYMGEGELSQALQYNLKSLARAEALQNYPYQLTALNNLGCLYGELGKFENAIETLDKGLTLTEMIGLENYKKMVYDSLFIMAFNYDKLDLAQSYVDQLQQGLKSPEDVYATCVIPINRALLLSRSSGSRNRIEAETILRDQLKNSGIMSEMRERAILHLVKLLQKEFELTEDIEILSELNELLNDLLALAQQQHSSRLIVEIYILQTKQSLIQFEFTKARQKLTAAQEIANKFGLSRLSRNISMEHDDLLQKLDVWKKFRTENVPISERMKFARVSEQMNTMIKKGEISEIDLEKEKPMIFLVITTGGLPIFTQIFSNEWDFSEEIFGGFLTAINTFSNEIFAKGLDRAKFGEYTITMQEIGDFRACYVYQGQSFLALQKINQFSESLKVSESLWDTFTQYAKTSQVINVNSYPQLELLVQEVFLS
ncbi:MAG: tetratricopeptide repeat protein [Promethearchaeota archaeon]